MKKSIDMSKKLLIFLLAAFLCIGMIGCKNDSQNDPQTNTGTESANVNTEPATPANSIDNELTPIENVEVITDAEVTSTLLADLSELSDLTMDPAYKGVELIAKHDGKLKSIPLEYPFVNWVSKQDKPVLIEFVASYSEPAQKSLPYLYSIAEKYDGDLLVCKVDIEAMPEYVNTFELEYVPTFYVSKDLTLYIVSNGFDPYASPSLVENIEQVINN